MRNYRRIIATAILLLAPIMLPSAVFAQRADLSLNGNAVVLALNGQTVNEDGKGRAFVIAGNSNKVKIAGDCKSMTLTGNENEVELDRVGIINLAGNENQATYLSGLDPPEPTISKLGAENKAFRRSPEVEGSKPVQGNQPKEEVDSDLVVAGARGQHIAKRMSGQNAMVNTGGNDIELTGKVNSLVVNGGGNHITAENVSTVVLNGSGNYIAYTGKKPQVTDNGHSNTISEQE